MRKPDQRDALLAEFGAIEDDVAELAGKHCEVSRFTGLARIETADDVEDEITLTMDFLTTDAQSGSRSAVRSI